MRIVSVAGVLPEHRYPQQQITEMFTRTMLRGAVDLKVVERLHANAGVEHRSLALPLERYAELEDFGQSNDAFIEVGVELGARAVTDALKAADLTPARTSTSSSPRPSPGSPSPPSRRGWPPSSACGPTSCGCRWSGWAASPARRAWRGCTTTSWGTPTRSRC